LGDRAYNDNKPFDEFSQADRGDLLPNPTLDQLIATGFHRNNITTNEVGPFPRNTKRLRQDRADTTASVFLGLTAGCATCHDHKFDRSRREFYALTAFSEHDEYVMDGNVSIRLRPRGAEDAIAIAGMISSSDRKPTRRSTIGDLPSTRRLRLAGSGRIDRLRPAQASAALMTLGWTGTFGRVEGKRTPSPSLGAAIGEGPSGSPHEVRERSWRSSLAPLDSDTPFPVALGVSPRGRRRLRRGRQDDPDDDLQMVDGHRGTVLTSA
jgi:hypothetical protein